MSNPRYEYFDNDHPSFVEESLRRSLGQHARQCEYVYVGRTNNPEERLRTHQRNLEPGVKKWDEMLVVYGSRSLGSVVQIENALIEHVRRENYQNVRWNEKGPQWDGPQQFAVYLLVDSTGHPKQLDEYTATWPEGRLSGHYNLVLGHQLQDRLRRHAKGQKNIYVGLTNNPLRRIGEHQRKSGDRWDELIVLYETSSLDYAALAESMLIRFASENFATTNIGPGMVPDDINPYFYIYFLLDRVSLG